MLALADFSFVFSVVFVMMSELSFQLSNDVKRIKILLNVFQPTLVASFEQVFDHIDVRMDPDEDYYTQKRRWYFGWGYGCGWASCIVLFGAFCLFLVCRIEDEIYEAEKTYKVEKHKTTEGF